MKFSNDEKMLLEAYNQVHSTFSVLTEYRGNKLNNMMTRGWHTTKAGRSRAGGRVDVNNDINKVSDKFYKAFSGGQPVEGAVFKRWLQKQMGSDININGSPAFMRIPDTIETTRSGLLKQTEPMGIQILHDVIGDAHKIKLGGASPAAPKKPYAWEPKGGGEEEEKRHGTTILGNDDNTEEDETAHDVAPTNAADGGGDTKTDTTTDVVATGTDTGPVTPVKEPETQDMQDELDLNSPEEPVQPVGASPASTKKPGFLHTAEDKLGLSSNETTSSAEPVAPAAAQPVAAPGGQQDRNSKLYKGQLTPGTPEYKAKHGTMDSKNLPQHSKSPEDYTKQIIKLQHQIEDSPDRRSNAKLQKKLDGLFESRARLERENILTISRSNILAKSGFMSDSWGNF